MPNVLVTNVYYIELYVSKIELQERVIKNSIFYPHHVCFPQLEGGDSTSFSLGVGAGSFVK